MRSGKFASQLRLVDFNVHFANRVPDDYRAGS